MEVDDELGLEIDISDNEFELENENVDNSEANGGEHESTQMDIEEKVTDSLEDGNQENAKDSSKQQDLREKLANKKKNKKQKKERQKNHEKDEGLGRSMFCCFTPPIHSAGPAHIKNVVGKNYQESLKSYHNS